MGVHVRGCQTEMVLSGPCRPPLRLTLPPHRLTLVRVTVVGGAPLVGSPL